MKIGFRIPKSGFLKFFETFHVPFAKIFFGGIYINGKVKKIVDFGAFIELPGGVDGLIHISKLSDGHVSRVSDVLKEGDEIMVEIVEFKGNKIGLGRAK